MQKTVQPGALLRLDAAAKVVLAFGLMTLISGLISLTVKISLGLYRLGPLTLLALAIGAGLVWAALRPRGRRWNRVLFLALVNCVGVYVLMLVLDLIVYLRRPTDRMRAAESTQNLFVLDDAVAFKLAPNFRGFYEDGKARLEIRTNSLGHRDDEPRLARPEARRLILAGDSFTFGVLLALCVNGDQLSTKVGWLVLAFAQAMALLGDDARRAAREAMAVPATGVAA